MISAKVIADSKNEFGNRITTMVVTFPRIILAEFNTHRMFSRNSASSRAIPFEKMVKSVEENPFIPIAWQKDHKGMQGVEYFNEEESKNHVNSWRLNAFKASLEARTLNRYGITKQLCNRLLEPFMWHTVLVTTTEWENFFALRCPSYEIELIDEFDMISDTSMKIGKTHTEKYRSKKDLIKVGYTHYSGIPLEKLSQLEWLKLNKGQAEIHMMALAEAMWDAYNESVPKELKAGEWHIPFGGYEIKGNKFTLFARDYLKLDISDEKIKIDDNAVVSLGWENYFNLMVKIATARCARVSYTVVGEEGKQQDYQKDIELHDRLAKSGHWSPFEHCAKAMHPSETSNWRQYYVDERGERRTQFGVCGNFQGFIQYRKMFENENITK